MVKPDDDDDDVHSVSSPVLKRFDIFASDVMLRLDLGVDPNKSTPVDLGIRSRVGSILLGTVDPPSNLKRKVTLVLLCWKST